MVKRTQRHHKYFTLLFDYHICKMQKFTYPSLLYSQERQDQWWTGQLYIYSPNLHFIRKKISQEVNGSL